MAWIAGILGLVLFAAFISDAFEVMLLPRRVRRQLRLVRFFFRYTWRAWFAIARRMPAGKKKDAFLSVYGPLSMVLLLSFWAWGLILSIGLFQWAFQAATPTAPTLLTSIYSSGASFFTVASAEVLPKTALGRSLAVAEAGLGLGFIAVTIGYLPVLYQLFSRRESHVIQLDARAGSPPTATALLCRHGEHEAMPELSSWLREWEQWCAELVESHLSYPMLSYYRSQHDNQSWLGALATILDSCALLLTGFKGVRTFSARMAFPMARLAVVELSRVFRLPLGAPRADRLPAAKFDELQDLLSDAGLAFSESETAQDRLRSLRATYEPFLFALSDHFMISLPGWISGHEADNWQRSSGGKTAKRLVESAPLQPE